MFLQSSRFIFGGISSWIDDPWYDHMLLDLNACVDRGWPLAGDDLPEMIEEINHSLATPLGERWKTNLS